MLPFREEENYEGVSWLSFDSRQRDGGGVVYRTLDVLPDFEGVVEKILCLDVSKNKKNQKEI